ncbi:alginate lyase [candidate division KSB1 bacterium]|nr:alginate lyase [candidate division KSB1 bacterium]
MIKLKNLLVIVVLISIPIACDIYGSSGIRQLVAEQDKDWVLSKADEFLQQEPVTVTAYSCERSEGGLHDFYSEGDYWWPDPDNPDGPYIRRDGRTNPDNFTAHRKVMRSMSMQVATLTAAYKMTGEEKYAEHAIKHLHAWFIDEDTRMSPHMKYAQAIKGRVPGRGVGLIDGIHLVEPARAISYLAGQDILDPDEFEIIRTWFSYFLSFMTTHEYGIDERDRKNNHGTCWVMQAAEFARLTENQKITEFCRNRYKTVLLPNQMAENGSFPMELERTKPYGYSLFNIDAMAMVCHILSTPQHNLWEVQLSGGQGMEEGMSFIFPYIKDKSRWILKPDVMYWDQWPVRHPSLLFAGMAYDEQKWIDLWKTLDPLPETEEGMRNFPIRQPILWVN